MRTISCDRQFGMSPHLIQLSLLLLAMAPITSVRSETSSGSARWDDIAMLKREYLTKEEALSSTARQRAEQLVSRIEARAEDKTDAEFVIAAMQLTALANSGGSLVLPAGPGSHFPRLPVRMALFDDGLLIVHGRDKARELAGATVLAIDGKPTGEVVDHAAHFFGGAEHRRKSLIPMMLEVPALMHGARLAERPDRMRLRLELPDGRMTEAILAVATSPITGPSWWPERWSLDGYEGSDWSYASREAMPLYLREFETPLREAPLANGKGRFVQLKWTPDWDREAGLTAIRDILRRVRNLPPRFLVFDMRFDHGASSPEIATAIADTVAALPQSTLIYLLVGRYTHHQGIATAAAIMKAGGDRATAIGEDMGDWLVGPRWGGRVCFKSVAACSTFSKKPEGVTDETMRQPASFPIVSAAPTAKSIRQGTDPALEHALALAR